MKEEIASLQEDHSASPLYSEDFAPVPANKRTWNKWHIAAIWIGMAVCIPTYMLAASMITAGIHWFVALLIIGLANLIITIPMVLNGHAGVKYGIPFPVLGRSSFGTAGVHLPAIVRAIVACGWFGIQTWIGGEAIYAIYCALTSTPYTTELGVGKFVCFGIFWLVNVYFIVKGTESIKWLEQWSAPILILMGLILIGWGATEAGGFGVVLKQSEQLQKPAAWLYKDDKGQLAFVMQPLLNKDGTPKANEYKTVFPTQMPDKENVGGDSWQPTRAGGDTVILAPAPLIDQEALLSGEKPVVVQMRNTAGDQDIYSSEVEIFYSNEKQKPKIWQYILWLTGMVGFWATMSLSIADITRYTDSQQSQVKGQFIGLPGTMILYSFVGIFVTCAAVVNFKDVLIVNDAPWDPVNLLARFESPVVIIVAQIFMLIATLSTNIAANVIAPANAFSNLWPKKINFATGGVIAAIIGILVCPWLIMGQIINLLLIVSGLLGPVLGIMLCDYYSVRKLNLNIDEFFKVDGVYSYTKGINIKAFVALFAGVGVLLLGLFVENLRFLYDMSWFIGFGVSYLIYYLLMRKDASLQSV